MRSLYIHTNTTLSYIIYFFVEKIKKIWRLLDIIQTQKVNSFLWTLSKRLWIVWINLTIIRQLHGEAYLFRHRFDDTRLDARTCAYSLTQLRGHTQTINLVTKSPKWTFFNLAKTVWQLRIFSFSSSIK